jgi:hypothetical protein
MTIEDTKLREKWVYGYALKLKRHATLALVHIPNLLWHLNLFECRYFWTFPFPAQFDPLSLLSTSGYCETACCCGVNRLFGFGQLGWNLDGHGVRYVWTLTVSAEFDPFSANGTACFVVLLLLIVRIRPTRSVGFLTFTLLAGGRIRSTVSQWILNPHPHITPWCSVIDLRSNTVKSFGSKVETSAAEKRLELMQFKCHICDLHLSFLKKFPMLFDQWIV